MTAWLGREQRDPVLRNLLAGGNHDRTGPVLASRISAAHRAAAREAWTSIDRPDLVALLDQLG